jgi:hypothetical protein
LQQSIARKNEKARLVCRRHLLALPRHRAMALQQDVSWFAGSFDRIERREIHGK